MVRHQPFIVNVAHISADFADKGPATVSHVAVSLHRLAALEVCLDPVNAILSTRFVAHKTCIMNLFA